MTPDILSYIEHFRKLCLSGNFNEAISLEFDFYNLFVKKMESLDDWILWIEGTYEVRSALLKSALELKKLSPEDSESKQERVLFVYHNFSGLAHETQLIRKLTGLLNRGVSLSVDVAYVFGGNESLPLAHSIWGPTKARVHFLNSKSYTEGFFKISLLARKIEVSAIIYPSIFFLAFWSSLYVSHPNQKFLVMKYPPPRLGLFTEFGSGLPGMEKRIPKVEPETKASIKFRYLPVELFVVDSSKSQPREDFISFGSISRVEKQADPVYIQFVLDLLDKDNKLNYLYTCREGERSKLPVSLTSHPRAVWLGWVNPHEAIDRFDIYLETFPWGGGDMSFLAVSKGIPYIGLATKESESVGVIPVMRELSALETLIKQSFPSSIRELQDQLLTLANDPDLRFAVGNAWKDAIQKSFSKGDEDWRAFLVR